MLLAGYHCTSKRDIKTLHQTHLVTNYVAEMRSNNSNNTILLSDYERDTAQSALAIDVIAYEAHVS